MLEKIKIKNYRSICNEEIPLSNLTAFIGQNNSGKSNILKALDILLGERWPTAPFDDEDFFNYATSNPIEIETKFRRNLATNTECWGFKLTYNGSQVDYFPIDQNGARCQYSKYINRYMRDEAFLMYIGLDRKTEYQLKPTKWTIYGKLIKRIEETLTDINKSTFINELDINYNTNLFPTLRTTLQSVIDYTKEQTGLDLDFEFKSIDPLSVLKNIRPYIRETTTRLTDVDNVGAGIQSAITIALARAYADIVQRPVTIVMEEPELYLHPHACRHFYKLLKSLSGPNLQIIYATHERCFVNINDYQSIRIVKKVNNETKVKYVTNLATTPSNDLRLISKCDESMNELFFARTVIFVEGFDDKLACILGLAKEGVDIDKENVSVIEASGRGDIYYLCNLTKQFDIKTLAIYDEDATSDIRRTEALIGSLNVFVQRPDNLEGMLGISGHVDKIRAIRELPIWFQNNPNPSIYSAMKTIL